MGMSFEGAADIEALGVSLTLAAVGVDARAALIVAKTAADIVRNAQAIVPVDTGYLKNSITFDMTGPAEAEVGPSANYAAFVEFGTSRMGPRPYMGPAFDRNVPLLIAAAAQLDGL